jgi:hypothetical protein
MGTQGKAADFLLDANYDLLLRDVGLRSCGKGWEFLGGVDGGMRLRISGGLLTSTLLRRGKANRRSGCEEVRGIAEYKNCRRLGEPASRLGLVRHRHSQINAKTKTRRASKLVVS